MLALGANAGNPEKFFEFVEVIFAFLINVIDKVHPELPPRV
jgi:hypothetical protein